MKKLYSSILSFLFIVPCFSQQDTGSSTTMDEVTVRAFEQNRNLKKTITTVKIISLNNSDRNNKTSLVNSFNSLAGVRMEERSPGSYRINIRGSSLRSPFGVRNVKVYWNDIPLTDAGGNTYFNQLAWNNFSNIEIFKGPASSMYGAGTGGLILINNNRWQPGASLEYLTGSYGLQNIFAAAGFGSAENRNKLTYAHNQSDGYRVQSAMRRDNFSWTTQLRLSGKQQLNAAVLFTDMYYQTPGALTLNEYNSNPKAARPAGGGFPGAVNAKAAIFQKNITAGFTHIYTITPVLKNTTTLYGNFSQVKNAAIRNYERRNEPGFGGRTVFVFTKKTADTDHILRLTAGSEFQQGYFNTQVSKNRNGNPDTLQTNDDINQSNYSLFVQGDISWHKSWHINAGISLNKSIVSFTRLSVYPVMKQTRRYQEELAPRLSLKKDIRDDFFLRATVSRGFSPPTTAELLPSTGVISTELEAEYGWNYEMTASYYLLNNRLSLEATGFYFKLRNALVQRRDLSGADYFVNAGDSRQKGVEFTSSYSGSTHHGFIDHYTIQGAYAWNHFRYGDFRKGTEDFSGKTIPSVPAHTVSVLGDLYCRNGLYTEITFYAASKIFLNDANTATATGYQLLGARLGWKKTFNKKYKLDIYTGTDNLLDKTYSLGNDINASANRFYNAAPRRNYYIGIGLQWIQIKNRGT